MPITVRFEQRSNTARVLRGMERNTEMLVGRTVDVMQATAMVRAPVRTGYLKSSITKSHTPGSKAGEVNVGAFYGLYVERGTRNMRAQPFLGPAATDALVGVLRPGLRTIFRYR